MESNPHQRDLKITFLGAFDSAEVELAFRQSQHRQEFRQAMLAVGVGLVSSIAFIPTDIQLLGFSLVFWTLLAIRSLQGAANLATILLLWRGVRPVIADRLLLVWGVYGAGLTLCIGYTRPTFLFTGYIFVSLFLLLILYFVVPLPVEHQIAVATLSFVGNTYLLLLHPDLNALLIRSLVFGYLMTNVLGVVISWNRHHLKREQFAALLRLEDALAEVKNLRGILPICAHCKNVRNDDGYWQAVEVYVREHSAAEFSHGICPDCAQTYFPGVLERRRKGEV